MPFKIISSPLLGIGLTLTDFGLFHLATVSHLGQIISPPDLWASYNYLCRFTAVIFILFHNIKCLLKYYVKPVKFEIGAFNTTTYNTILNALHALADIVYLLYRNRLARLLWITSSSELLISNLLKQMQLSYKIRNRSVYVVHLSINPKVTLWYAFMPKPLYQFQWNLSWR